jgi:hypothetical protein
LPVPLKDVHQIPQHERQGPRGPEQRIGWAVDLLLVPLPR